MSVASFAVPFAGLDPLEASLIFSPARLPHFTSARSRWIAGWQLASSCFTQTPTPQDAPPQDGRRYCDGSSYYAAIGPTGVR